MPPVLNLDSLLLDASSDESIASSFAWQYDEILSIHLDICLKKSYKMYIWTYLPLFVDWLYQ